MTDKSGNKLGRPTKYRKDLDDKVFKLCLLGCTDLEICEIWALSEATLNNWKNKHRSFLESMRAGRADADMKVAASMYERACGYTKKITEEYVTEEVVAPISIDKETGKKKNKVAQAEQDFDEFKEAEDAKTVKYKHSKITKEVHMPADFNSMSLWLRNRQPKKWRDKPESTEGNNNGITLEGVVANKNAISSLLMPQEGDNGASV